MAKFVVAARPIESGSSMREMLDADFAERLQAREADSAGAFGSPFSATSAVAAPRPLAPWAGRGKPSSRARGAWAGRGAARVAPPSAMTSERSGETAAGADPDADYAAALRLQEQFDAEEAAARVAAAVAASMTTSVPARDAAHPATLADDDASLALAMQLQEAEHQAGDAQGRTVGGTSHVRLIARHAPVAALPAPTRQIYSADDFEALAHERDVPAGAVAAAEAARTARDAADESLLTTLRGRAARGARPALAPRDETAPGGISSDPAGTGEDDPLPLVTKHDAELCGRRAARQLEREFGHLTGDLTGVSLSAAASSTLRRHLQKGMAKGHAAYTRVESAAHATREAVLDARTRMILFKLVGTGRLDVVAGVVREGKEAAVFRGVGWHDDVHRSLAEDGWHGQNNQVWEVDDDDDDEEEEVEEEAAAGVAERVDVTSAAGGVVSDADPDTAPDGDLPEDVAIKIFKMTLNEFKDRREYVAGDRRFSRMKLSHANPRKTIVMWAMKEFQNLVRLFRAGIPCPAPLALRGHVIVMSFIGEDGWSAPQLREVGMTSTRGWSDAYAQTVAIMTAMYQWCHLVHADLSEFNLLLHDGRVFVIDVGQAVDASHPSADDFLLADATHITTFFAKKGVDVLPPVQLVQLVKDDRIMPHPPAAVGGYRTGSYAGHVPATGSGPRMHKFELAAAAMAVPMDCLEAAAVAAAALQPSADAAPVAMVDEDDEDCDPFDGVDGPIAHAVRARLSALDASADAGAASFTGEAGSSAATAADPAVGDDVMDA